MMKTTPRERVTAVSQRGRPMRRCRQLTHSDHELRGSGNQSEYQRSNKYVFQDHHGQKNIDNSDVMIPGVEPVPDYVFSHFLK